MQEVHSFEEFASSRARRLFQVGYLMCGDWHQAQDLVQTALGRLYASWGRLQRQVPAAGLDAYARKVLLNCYLSHRRLRRSGELTVGELPETAQAGDGAAAELRLTLLQALRQLPPRNRAAVVLRYLEDYSVDAVAEMLNTTPSAVKSLNTRSLARLRELLGDDRELLFRD
ncbi:SigE family RNA polymerase sigma factor [Kitasatospora viridis]|uniref:RNA polymerase sigma-70 factor (Sigma-E family) n=1 Tax=Kitasatospora viridis TaxID=281105 RepID=A0A561UPE8_9ACTN|nr:SigE family RNA polymerase sigma factor [Kitasatospora viridis]TWG01232.1 RNA polymerase sigma-70 factor (sigma-E family) [Kitasatospora viridis]